MGWTAEQRRTATIAAGYGYRNSIREQSLPAADISVGDGLIVLTDKGEPIMSGQVAALETSPGGEYQVKIGEEWYCSRQHSFRRI
jgi:hypothetical protein